MTTSSVKSVCPYCGVGCGIVMEVKQGRVLNVLGDKQHPTNFGRLCTKGKTSFQAIAESGRLERAMLREERSGEPAQTSIAHAIARTGQRLRRILDTHGPDAISFYVSGQMSLEAQYLANKLAKGFVRTQHIESNSRLCMASAGSGYKLSLGADGPPGSYQDFEHADLFFVIGANMADCHPILFLRMMDRVKAGAKLIVVDPRRNTTGDKADLFLQIKPGTDLALLNGLLHLLVKNGETDTDFITQFTEGWDVMASFVEEYPPGRVAEITGLPEADIRRAAALIGGAKNFMSCWTMGLNQSTHGTWNTNAVCNLHLATGAICRPGSGPFSLTGQPNAMGGREMGYMGPGLPGQRSALSAEDRSFVEDLWSLPHGTLRSEAGEGTVAMFEAMKAGRIKACWIICTNPVATVPNRQTAIAGLEAAELVITQDAFRDTETNRYADIMLPGALWAEAEGVMVNSERNLTLMQRAVEAPGDALPDWQIIARVAQAMGFDQGFDYPSADAVFEELKRAHNPKTGYDLRGASHARLRETPLQWPISSASGPDRNPIRYLTGETSGVRRRVRFPTATGKAVFFARPHLPPAELPDADFPFVLNTGRLQHQWHTLTKTGKVPTLNKLNPGPFVELHREDAAQLGISNADRVEVRSRRGRAVLPALVSDRVLPGACFVPFHWNDVYGASLAINAVTNDAIDPVSMQPEFKFCAVRLARLSGPPRDITPPTPPASTDDQELDMQQVDALAKVLKLDAAWEIALDASEQLYLRGYLTGLRNARVSGVPVLPKDAPVSHDKRLMLDGVLAGMFARSTYGEGPVGARAQTAAEPATATSAGAVTVLWASQTGNAEGIAARFAKQLSEGGYAVKLAAMDAVAPAELTKASQLLVVTSTFGDGDPPDNGSTLWEALNAVDAPRLRGTRFSVLALGDSSYGSFCGFGKKLDARLEALGASRMCARIDCEPEFEDAALGWLTSVETSLKELPSTPLEDATPGPKVYTRQAPLRARLALNRRLNADGAEKETRQIAFDLGDSGLSYEAGDALGVWPTNCEQRVAELLDGLALSPDSSVSVKDHGELPLREALTRHYEISKITPDLLGFVRDRAGSAELTRLLEPAHQAELADWLWGRQLVDLVRAFPIAVDPATWLGKLKRLQPRLYSIASSPKLYPREVHLTVSTVRYARDGRARGGVCSTFLADRAEREEAGVFVQKSPHFRPPRNTDTPMIMVGPGTGIAPFRAFLQDRQADAARGRNWLFFGEQRERFDYYYRDEIAALQTAGVLHRLDTAFSRDQTDKVYVQQRMREQGKELFRWLDEGAHFYVCGDASRMAKDVDTALRDVVQTHGAMSAERAAAYVKQLAHDKRYVRDVY